METIPNKLHHNNPFILQFINYLMIYYFYNLIILNVIAILFTITGTIFNDAYFFTLGVIAVALSVMWIGIEWQRNPTLGKDGKFSARLIRDIFTH